MRRLAAALALSALVVGSSAELARADAGSAASKGAPKGALVPPRQLDAPAPAYPDGAHGDASVVLEIDVGADGDVIQARVIEGDEPFASAARTAALRFRFEPATRGGTPIRATIRARVEFIEPAAQPQPQPQPQPKPKLEPQPKPTPRPQPAPTSSPTKAATDEPIELTVEGERREIATTQVGRAEVRVMPGAFGDPFRVIEALPGVTPIVSGLPFFYVRGAPPGNTGYFLDGLRVPLLFHVGAGPSVIAPGMIDRVDFWSGGYPAGYGRFSGGVVAGVTTPPKSGTHGEWQVRLFDASAMIESQIGSCSDAAKAQARPADGHCDRDATVLVAGRYGYPGLLLSLFSPDTSLAYWDYQLRVAKRVSDRDVLSVFTFGAYDSLYDKKHDKQIVGTQFHRADLRLDHELDRGHLRVATTVGYERSAVDGGDSSTNRNNSIADLGARLRVELEERIRPEALLRAGADVSLDRYELFASSDSNGRDAQQLIPSRLDAVTGAWIDFVVHPARGVEIVPGLRFDVYRSGGAIAPAFEPRLATKIAITRDVSWISTFGVAHQMPSFFVPVSGLQPSLGRGLQEAWQFSEGIEAKLPAKITSSLALFHHSYRNLSDLLATCVDTRPSTRNEDCNIDERATGRSDGLEVLVKRDLGERLGFWLAYTLSRTTRSFRGETFASDFDRTHVLSASGSAVLGSGWRFGARFSYVTGRPVTTSFGAASPGGGERPTTGVASTFPPSGVDPNAISYEQWLTVRLPAFYRLDVRLEKRWQLTDTRWMAFTIEWFNATLSKEAVSYTCDARGRCGYDTIGPVTIPSLGLEGGF
jgi:TonB family protein